MKFKQNEWIGNWVNFESYIYSQEEAMKQCWNDAENCAKTLPMFKNGVKSFWEMACNTINEENNERLGGWNITAAGDGIKIEWLNADSRMLGKYNYIVADIIPKGLESKENFLFEATNAAADCPFRYMLAMEPMPERGERKNGGLLSHLHFQFASSIERLIKNDTICNMMWYATMCDGDGSLLERCNVVRVLHRMPKWDKLPE